MGRRRIELDDEHRLPVRRGCLDDLRQLREKVAEVLLHVETFLRAFVSMHYISLAQPQLLFFFTYEAHCQGVTVIVT